jgi:hypothetical protein
VSLKSSDVIKSNPFEVPFYFRWSSLNVFGCYSKESPDYKASQCFRPHSLEFGTVPLFHAGLQRARQGKDTVRSGGSKSASYDISIWPMMTIVGRRPVLWRKFFKHITCMCCRARFKTVVFKICFVKNNRIFRFIRILLLVAVIVVFLHSKLCVLCWSDAWAGLCCCVRCVLVFTKWFGRDAVESYCDVMELPFRHFPGGTEENHRKKLRLYSDSWGLCRASPGYECEPHRYPNPLGIDLQLWYLLLQYQTAAGTFDWPLFLFCEFYIIDL